MNIEVFFHDCFTTSNEYKKVIVSIEKNGKYYLFGAVCNKQTNKIEVQRFAERDEKSAKFLIHGRKGYAKKYQDMTANELQIFAENISSLSRAMQRFFQLNMPFDDLEKNEIRDVVCNINFNNTKTVEPSLSWITADLNQLSAKEMTEITKLISTIGHNPDGTIYNDKKYRLIEENGKLILQECCIANVTSISESIEDTEVTANNNSVNFNVRNFISMAKIVNAENLADIVAGNFYPIIDKRDVNGKNYYIIDVNGNNKAVSSNRIKKINVFTEIP
jgi:hypothetical protein